MELGLGIAMPRKKIDGVLLNATQYNQIIKYMNIDRAGRVPGDDDYDAADGMLGDLTKIVLSDAYKSLPTKEDKRNFLNKTVSERKSYAVKRLRSEDIALDTKILQVQ